GDHTVHCSSEVGVKLRHNLVHDILVEICSKVKIMDKDACLDVTGISPFAGMRASSWPPEVALNIVVEKKNRKYASICADNGYKFIPFAFSTFGEFDKDALDTLSRISSLSICHSNNVKSGTFIFLRVSFVDMFLYSWDGGLDVCVCGSLPLTQIGMADFVPGRAVIDVAQRKRVKYMSRCAAIGYGFLPFSFSSLGELEKDVVTLLKRIHKFSMV
nr:hypothetical protein [Tanacetum cinerariifolium]